jgi:hypothetical protein
MLAFVHSQSAYTASTFVIVTDVSARLCPAIAPHTAPAAFHVRQP